MKMRIWVGLALCAVLSGPSRAATFVPQARFPMPLSATKAIDRDAVGNLYVLGQPSGASTYAVSVYQTQDIQPLQSFDTGLNVPVAFVVEASGSPDVLAYDQNTGAIFLKRFGNTGAVLGQTTMPYTIVRGYTYAAAIDKVNKWVYLSKFWRITPCLDLLAGCDGPPAGTQGFVYQYDFQGNLLRTFTLPGNTSSAGSCYEPHVMTVDPQGNLIVADTYCHHLLRYSSSGALLADAALDAQFYPTSIWTDSGGNVYTNQYLCTSACMPGVSKYSTSGTLLASIVTDATTSFSSLNNGAAWDGRILYMDTLGAPPLRRYILDNLPSVPAQTAPIGSVVQHSSAAALSWQVSTDADGDPLVYTVYLGVSPTALQPVGQSAMNSLTTQSLAFGGTYYWQVVGQDSYLGLPIANSTSPIVSFNLGLLNHPPDPFAFVTGTGTAVTRSTSAAIAWQSAPDPDGDPVVYDVSWQASRASTPTVVTTTATLWQMSGLSFGTTAYWSVTARDTYGATRPMTGGTLPYLPLFLNNPPPAPAATAGTGIIGQHTLMPAVTLAWSPVTDPDGDPVAYRIMVGVSSTSLAVVQDSTATTFTLTPTFGTTYYWQAAAYDPYGGVSTSAAASMLVYQTNNQPQAFAVTSGSGTVLTRQAVWPLSWQPAIDPDGDAVTYDVAVGTATNSLTLLQTSSATTCPLGLQFGTTYYWQVTARDGFGGSSSSGLQVLVPVFLNTAPDAPQLAAISPTVKTMDGGVRVSWSKVASPQGDALTYTAYVGDSPKSLSAVASVIQSSANVVATAAPRALGLRPAVTVLDQGDSVVLLITGLDYYKNYYLRVGAETTYGAQSQSGLQSFLLAAADGFPRAYNYPNPFSPNRGDTHIVFNAPPSGYTRAVLTVYSEFGEKLFEHVYGPLAPGITQYDFDGRDSSGRPLMNGSYVGRVRFDGPSDRATFFLLVVK